MEKCFPSIHHPSLPVCTGALSGVYRMHTFSPMEKGKKFLANSNENFFQYVPHKFYLKIRIKSRKKIKFLGRAKDPKKIQLKEISTKVKIIKTSYVGHSHVNSPQAPITKSLIGLVLLNRHMICTERLVPLWNTYKHESISSSAQYVTQFSHPSFSYFSIFQTLSIRLKQALQIVGRLVIATHLDQSNYLGNQQQVLGLAVPLICLSQPCKNAGPKPFC